MRRKRGVRAVVLLFALLSALPQAFAAQFQVPQVMSFLIGPRGFLARLNVFLSNPYVQYFGTLFAIGLTITMIVKSVLKNFLSSQISEEKFQNVIAIIIGFGTANGIFVVFRHYSVENSFLTMWGTFFTIIMFGGIIGIPLWVMFTGHNSVRSVVDSLAGWIGSLTAPREAAPERRREEE